MVVKVAVLGYGIVGSGVVELLDSQADMLTKKAGNTIEVKYILDVREFPDSPYKDRFVKDFSIIEQDAEIDIVIEAIGGTTVALAFTERALRARKNVVTSNKELVAKHGETLLQLAQKKRVSYMFEASVGGGIPILRPLSQCMIANTISEICGIVNGTSNYIFTRMVDDGLGFKAALREAQEHGYAEQNPAADLEGWDTCRKICILASVAYGFHVLPEQVPTVGITSVTLEDFAYAEACRKRIKLLGRAIDNQDGTICAYVEPNLVSYDNPLSGVKGVFNAITLNGSATGDVMFYGQGAGKMPTASSVVADIMDIMRHMTKSGYAEWNPPREDGVISPDSLSTQWLVRMKEGQMPRGHEIKLKTAVEGEKGFLTEAMTRPELDDILKEFDVVSVIRVLD